MTDLKAAAEAAKAAVWPSTEYIETTNEFQRLATPDAVLALYAERDGAFLTSQQAAQSYSNLMRVKDDIDAQRQAAEASLASYKEEVERLRKLLDDWRPHIQAVIAAASAIDERFVEEFSRVNTLTKEPPHAE